MPHDLTPRSDSEASGSPPDHSETSSGVHSNSSRESNNAGDYCNTNFLFSFFFKFSFISIKFDLFYIFISN